MILKYFEDEISVVNYSVDFDYATLGQLSIVFINKELEYQQRFPYLPQVGTVNLKNKISSQLLKLKSLNFHWKI